ncbi:hypothetical protein OBRU01_04791 [Operophtera brumata]|uniref:DOMON domain-containing protein n=1 Tax=Operophtera brumata TaxID=104452 RepID=A0A0L7LP55_OPEBR|nr:hypothetical protein OBRU01_04791 [Operophtera brumata]
MPERITDLFADSQAFDHILRKLACIDQLPRHETILPQSSPPPYFILTSSAQVRQGDVLNVTVGSPAGLHRPAATARDHPAPVVSASILHPHVISSSATGRCAECNGGKPRWCAAADRRNQDIIVGKFINAPSGFSRLTTCTNANDTATHTSPEDKPALTFQWQAPADFLGGSPLVEVVTPDTVVSTFAPTAATERSTVPPPVIMVSKPKPTAQPMDVIYQGCADTKLCFGVPANCIEKGDCKAIVAIFVSGSDYTFEIQGTDNPKYVASGLSMDNKMGDDSAMECVRNDNGRISLFTSWTYPKVEPYVSRSDSPQEIVQLQESSLIDGKLYCKFKRDVVSTVKGNVFDLANNKYNLMLHGSFMLAAWLGTASLGILLARYFRQTWVGKTLGGKDIWFAVGGWSTTGDNPHAITGIVTVILCFIQPIGAYFRPHPGTNKRPIFNWLHWFFGNGAHILGTFVAFHVVMHIVLSLTVCVSDGRISNGRVNSFPMKDMMGHTRQFAGFRKLILGVFTPIIVIITVTMICLVALAPIGDTYNTIVGV